jgi:two-component system OmpR family response regulator
MGEAEPIMRAPAFLQSDLPLTPIPHLLRYKEDQPRVLLVDDEPVVRRLLRGALMRERWQVTEAATGAEALQAAGALPKLDILFVGTKLADVDGIALAQMLARHHHGLRIVYITPVVGGSPANAAEASLGSDELILRKPFLRVDLPRVVATLRSSLPAQPSKPTPIRRPAFSLP